MTVPTVGSPRCQRCGSMKLQATGAGESRCRTCFTVLRSTADGRTAAITTCARCGTRDGVAVRGVGRGSKMLCEPCGTAAADLAARTSARPQPGELSGQGAFHPPVGHRLHTRDGYRTALEAD